MCDTGRDVFRSKLASLWELKGETWLLGFLSEPFPYPYRQAQKTDFIFVIPFFLMTIEESLPHRCNVFARKKRWFIMDLTEEEARALLIAL